jgi:acetyl-CoA C-acetyltransferase
VSIPQKKGDPTLVGTDEGPRRDTTIETLTKLRPAFKEGGTVTAGNAPSVNDGAAALVVASREAPIDQDAAMAGSGLRDGWDRSRTPLLCASRRGRKLMDKLGMNRRFDLIEANEAFPRRPGREGARLGLVTRKRRRGCGRAGPPDRAGGARVLVTLLCAMKDRGARRLLTLCLGAQQRRGAGRQLRGRNALMDRRAR